jgi:hypothetical protein
LEFIGDYWNSLAIIAAWVANIDSSGFEFE